jgi:thioredoxin 1
MESFEELIASETPVLVDFYATWCGPCRTMHPILDELKKEKGEKLRLILDPPRAGIARSVLSALLQSGIPTLTLISCNPATLARDLGILTGSLIENENGELIKNPAYNADGLQNYYVIEHIQPYDMFPQTKHVETLVCLARKA